MKQQKLLLYTVYFIYFICGLAQCFEGVFLPEFKTSFNLSYTQQMFTLFSKNMPFVFFSLIIGYYLKKIGYKNALIISLFLFALGSWLIIPGLSQNNYGLVLVAFFIIGTAFNFELVAGNPMLAALGDQKSAASRLNIGNALGAVAQIIAPLIIVLVIPATVINIKDKLPYMNGIFIGTAIVLVLTGIAILFVKDITTTTMMQGNAATQISISNLPSVWKEPKIVLGFVAIFLIVGVEAGTFGLYRNFIEAPKSGGLTSHQSQQMFTLYFTLFAAGRLTASWVQKKMPAAITIQYSLVISLVLVAIIIFARGWLAIAAVTAIGFFSAMFFPTIYAIAIEGLGERTGQASGVLNMGFLGSALLPVLQGSIADKTNLSFSYIIALIPYLFVLFFVMRGKNLQSFKKFG